METNLMLVINDEIHININDFTETIVNIERDDLSRPQIYVTINNLETNLSFIANVTINTLSVSRDDEVLWSSDKYTTIKKLELMISEINSHYLMTII